MVVFAALFLAYKQGWGFQGGKKKNSYRVFKHRDLFYYEGGSDSQVAGNKLQTHSSQKFLIYLAQVYTQSYNKKITIYRLSWGISGCR